MKNIFIIILMAVGTLLVLAGAGLTGLQPLFWVGITILFCLWVATAPQPNKNPGQQHPGQMNHLKR